MSSPSRWSHAFFERHPVFRTEQFLAASPARESSARDLLKHYRRTGRISSIRTGMWHAPARLGDPPDPIAVAGCVAADAIVDLNGAMQSHGLGYSVFNVVVAYSSSRVRTFRVAGTTIRTVPHPRALLRANAADAATEQQHRMGSSIRVASRERALVDMLDRQDLSGGIEEIWRTARQLGWVDDRVLLQYLELRDSPSLIARTGYLLEHEPQVDIAADALEQMHRRASAAGRGPWRFAPHIDGPAPLDARWNLLVAPTALPSHWDEPLEW
jgi:predicted transcriptional regulator of viral defense system